MASTIDYLKEVFIEEGLIPVEGEFEKLNSERLNDSPLRKAALEVFEDLDGQGDELPLIDYRFDFELFGKAIILDDDIHFNRYRTFTMRSSIYDMLPEFPRDNYRRYCRTYETQCLKSASNGAMWSTPFAEKYFGKSNDNGDLGLTGSSVWKYRAYIDFIVDMSAMIFDYKIYRISIYDTLMIGGQIKTLKDLLSSRNPENKKYLASFFKKKISAITANGDHLFKKK